MKLLFVHDGTLKYDEYGSFYGTAVNPSTLFRYEHISDDITILIRTKPFEKGDDKGRYTKIPSKYNIEHCPNYMSVKGMLKERQEVKKKLKKLVKEHDIVIARFSGETGKMAARECEKTKTTYIVESVGCSWDAYWNYGSKGKMIAPYMFLSTRNLIKKSPYVIYVTSEFLQKRYPTQGEWIPASNVMLPDIDKRLLDRRIEKINNKSKEEPVVLGTASVIDVPYKGHAYVIEAISKLTKEGYNLQYQVLGSGDKTQLLNIAKSLGVEDRVDFLGVKPHEQVFDWFDGLDIYIQPSDQEGLPRALIEAMSRACPAIGSSTAGIPELLDQSCIFKRKQVGELIAIIKTMNKEKLLHEANRNFESSKNYQRNVINNRRKKFFDKVVDNM